MAFSFIHTGDLHLDSPLTGLSAHDDERAGQIGKASRRAFAELVDLAIARKVDVFLIAGDLWDGDWRDISAGLFVQAEAGRLRAAGIGVFAILGNHDAASHVTDRIRNLDTLHLFASGGPTSVEWGEAVIHGVSYETREVSENVAISYPDAWPGRINIGLLHTSLDQKGGEHATYAPCAPVQLAAKGYHYWALGHVHTRQRILEAPASQGGTIAFCGVLQGRHVRETGPKGAWLGTVEGERVTLTEITFGHVSWHLAEADLSGDVEPRRAMEMALEKVAGEATSDIAAVRINLVGETARHYALRSRERALAEEARFVAGGLGKRLLLERLVVATRPPVAAAPALPSGFGRYLARAAGDPELAGRAAEELRLMLAALPAGVRDNLSARLEGLAGFEADGDAGAFLGEAAERVAARLDAPEGEGA